MERQATQANAIAQGGSERQIAEGDRTPRAEGGESENYFTSLTNVDIEDEGETTKATGTHELKGEPQAATRMEGITQHTPARGVEETKGTQEVAAEGSKRSRRVDTQKRRKQGGFF